MLLKLIFIATASFTPVSYLIASVEDKEFWERVLEKWGIGFIGMALFGGLTYLMIKRESALQAKKDKLEAEDRAERIRLAEENNRLLKEQLVQAYQTSAKLERSNEQQKQIIKDNTKAMTDHSSSIRMLTRAMSTGRACLKVELTDKTHEDDQG